MEPSREYLRDCRFLSREEERALWQRLQNGDKQARDELTMSLLPFVVSRAVKYCRKWNYSLDDAIQAGNVGLLIAVDKFDPDKGRLSTIAAFWIDRQITLAAEGDTLIRLPQCIQHPDKNRCGFSDAQRQEWMKLRFPPDELHGGLADCPRQATRLSADELTTLREHIGRLTPVQRAVVEHRLSGMTFTEIAATRGITRQRAQQIFGRAVGALKRLYRVG